ncbi:MAG: helix-turn-helix domain-containing protein [Deltaproteobacteria bacterium]|nr:helix-turn-helix domain-containing protein [Deltaproteobacteria bacterium]
MNTELSQDFGECLTASELAKLLKLDRRTVVKYADRWGGVEVTPGTWRFFEKRILEVLNAEQGFEKRHITIQGKCYGSGANASKTLSRHEQKVISSSSGVGKGNKKGVGRETIPDKFGIFGGRSVVQ